VALVVWRLIGLNFPGRPDTPYWIEKDGRVLDVDAEGWERGVRPGMEGVTAQWHYPGARALPWRSDQFSGVHEEIQAWLDERMERFEQPEPWNGWWQWPQLGPEQFARHMAEMVPRWALFLEAGIASHPLLAQAALQLGKDWGLPMWAGHGFQAWVMSPSQETRWWPEIPLRLVEGISEAMTRQWGMRGWKRIGQVPGLQNRLQNLAGQKSPKGPETIQLRYQWEQEAEGGFVEVFTALAARLTDELRQRAVGFQRLEVIWRGPWGTMSHKRLWPTATGEAGSVLLRLLDFLKNRPPEPPESVEILSSELLPWGTEQLHWGFSPRSRHANHQKLWPGVRIGMDRREAVLQFWDPWRFSERALFELDEEAKRR